MLYLILNKCCAECYLSAVENVMYNAVQNVIKHAVQNM